MKRPVRPRGFILLAVLVALVVITLLATAVATVSSRAVDQALQDGQQVDAEIAQFSTRETLMFLLATQRQTVAGLSVDDQVTYSYGNALYTPDPDDAMGLPPPLPIGNEIALDGSPYAGLAGQAFALQDDAGLLSINWTPEPLRAGMLAGLGAEPARWASLEATRLDYQDPDDAYRIGGAEAPQYAENDLPPPTNATLRTPLQLRAMPGWRELVADLQDHELLGRYTVARSVVVNLNTAPRASLRTLPGASDELVERIMAQRRQLPFVLRWEFLRAFPVALDEESPINFLASGSGNLMLWDRDQGPVRLLHWSLTPVDEGGRPWRIDYELTLPRDKKSTQATARQPASALFTEPDPPRQ